MKRRQTVEPGPYMTAKEVAAYLRIHPTTVYRLLRDNQLQAFKIGSDWRFSRESIEKWIADRHQKRVRADLSEIPAWIAICAKVLIAKENGPARRNRPFVASPLPTG